MQLNKKVPFSIQLLELTKQTYRGRFHAYLMSRDIPYNVSMDIIGRMDDEDIKEICQFHQIRNN